MLPGMKIQHVLAILLAPLCSLCAITAAGESDLQARIDAAPPGSVIDCQGQHLLAKRLRIATPGIILSGFGVIIQNDPGEPILEIEHVEDVRIKDITLTRARAGEFPEPAVAARAPGLFINDARRVVIDGVRVLGHAARDAALEVRNCRDVVVRDCEVRDYKCIAVDDRTDSPLYGYAFRCIDGTGLLISESRDVRVTNNLFNDTRLLPTRKIVERFRLGELTEGKKPTQPGELGQGAVRAGRVNNWHQGSAIVVTAPGKTAQVQIQGNRILNAAQAIDLHCDETIVADNAIDGAMIGVKMTHGSRNIVVSGNLLNAIDLWGILLNPGAASHASAPAGEGIEAKPQNVDGGTLIAANVITNFGCGAEYWNWGGANEDAGGSYPIAIYDGQLAENPPLRDVLFTGNMVYDAARDEAPAALPRYRWAVYIASWHGPADKSPNMPRGLHFRDNLLHPGRKGDSNVPLDQYAGEK